MYLFIDISWVKPPTPYAFLCFAPEFPCFDLPPLMRQKQSYLRSWCTLTSSNKLQTANITGDNFRKSLTSMRQWQGFDGDKGLDGDSFKQC